MFLHFEAKKPKELYVGKCTRKCRLLWPLSFLVMVHGGWERESLNLCFMLIVREDAYV